MWKSIVNFFQQKFLKSEIKIQNLDATPIGVYFLNDPSTLGLTEAQVNIPDTDLKLSVDGFDVFQIGKSNSLVASQAINCKMSINRGIVYCNKIISKCRSPIREWSSTDVLRVITRAGEDFNANYDREALNFFHGPNPHTKKEVYCCDSSEIVIHELGHALLDAIRPDFWNVQNFETSAFHEAFGDITSMCVTMGSKAMVEHALAETNGNLMNSNCISRLAEELGIAIYNKPSHMFLRDATVPYLYKKPENLPDSAPENQIAAECHSFSRIFVGAWYQLVIKIFDEIKKTETNKIIALQTARDVCYLYLLNSVINVPNTVRLFDALARLMLITDQNKGQGRYSKIIKDVFEKRRILIPKIKILEEKSLEDFKKESTNLNVTFNNEDDLSIAHVRKGITIKAIDHFKGVMALDNDPIYNAELETACDSVYLFDKNENLIDEISETDKDIVNAALENVKMIKNHKLLGNVWKIEENKLVRAYVICGK